MARIAIIMCLVLLVCGALGSRGEAAQKVLFDTGHGERFLIGEKGPLQLSDLAEIFKAAGVHVASGPEGDN